MRTDQMDVSVTIRMHEQVSWIANPYKISVYITYTFSVNENKQ